MFLTAWSKTLDEDGEELPFLPELTTYDDKLEAPPCFVRFWVYKAPKKKKKKRKDC